MGYIIYPIMNMLYLLTKKKKHDEDYSNYIEVLCAVCMDITLSQLVCAAAFADAYLGATVCILLVP